MSRPGTTDHSPPLQVQVTPHTIPSPIPYDPSAGTAIETQSPSGVPSTQSWTWSIAALAAEAALEAPRAEMISAPRLATRRMNSLAIQASSSTASQAPAPSTLALTRSGYWVTEWLPQVGLLVPAETGFPSLLASCEIARLWSS